MAATKPVNWPTIWPMTVASLPVDVPGVPPGIGNIERSTCAAQSLPGSRALQLTSSGFVVCANPGPAIKKRKSDSRTIERIRITASPANAARLTSEAANGVFYMLIEGAGAARVAASADGERLKRDFAASTAR